MFFLRSSKKGQSQSITLFFVLLMLVPIIFIFGAPLLSLVGHYGVETTGLTGVPGLIMDNLAAILVIIFFIFILLWGK